MLQLRPSAKCNDRPSDLIASGRLRAYAATIEFTLAVSTRAHLSLFDMNGQEVAVLPSGVATSGTHRTTIDATFLPAGVYACRLQSGSDVVVEREIIE